MRAVEVHAERGLADRLDGGRRQRRTGRVVGAGQQDHRRAYRADGLGGIGRVEREVVLPAADHPARVRVARVLRVHGVRRRERQGRAARAAEGLQHVQHHLVGPVRRPHVEVLQVDAGLRREVVREVLRRTVASRSG